MPKNRGMMCHVKRENYAIEIVQLQSDKLRYNNVAQKNLVQHFFVLTGGVKMINNFKKVAQLKAKEVSNREIAKLTGINRNTVNSIVKKINEANISYIDVIEISEDELREIFKPAVPKRDDSFVLPNYEVLVKELARPGVTMQLLWEEYVDECYSSRRKSYKLTQFKKYFNEYIEKNEFTDVMKHKAGVRIETDWAGTKVSWSDPDTGEIQYGYLFVGVLSFSGYCFARVYADMKMASWLDAHIRMFDYFGGSTEILVSDNLKTGVVKHTNEEVVITKQYNDLAEYYSTYVVPGRVRRPKDKPRAEGTVNLMTTEIIARMRNYQFFSIDEYNKQLEIELERINKKPFQKKNGSRYSMYMEFEKDLLRPLPLKPYEICEWKVAKVQRNSHISVKKNYYSVPYKFIGQEVQLKIYSNYFEVYYKQSLICTHQLFSEKHIGAYETVALHMPENSNAYNEWNSQRYLNWARTKGVYTYRLVLDIFEKVEIEQTAYHTVHSILKLADMYSNDQLEDACHFALESHIKPTRKNIKFILDNNRRSCQEDREEQDVETTTFLRGGNYFGR